MAVLVTGADQRQGLAVIRALGRRGISVVAAAPVDRCIGFASRYAAVRWPHPPPLEQPAQFVSSLREAIKRFDVTLVMPVVESTLIVLNRYRDQIEPLATLATASREAVDLSLDKARHLDLARREGIPIPTTVTPSSLEELDATRGSLRLPVVLKPSVKPLGDGGDHPAFKVSFLMTWEALREQVAAYLRHGVQPVVQELCLGEGIGCGMLMDRGRAVQCYQYHRGRECPPTGGVPVRYASMPVWPHVRDYSERLLRAMNWHGVAQVEWKVRPGTQEMTLMEVNGRFWASLPGAIHAGMNFPVWTYELFAGKSPEAQASYRIGSASRYLRGDLKRLELAIRQPGAVSSVPRAARWRELSEFALDFFRWRVKGDVRAWDDPGPGWLEAASLFAEYGGRVFGRAGRAGG